DFVFLDGGNRPLEQLSEFWLLDPHIPVGGQLLAHDAKLRKGKWFAPYISRLDNWRTEIHDVSAEGLLLAKKIAPEPSPATPIAARRQLLKSRLQPAQIPAVPLPGPVRSLILRQVPRKFPVQLPAGRRVDV